MLKSPLKTGENRERTHLTTSSQSKKADVTKSPPPPPLVDQGMIPEWRVLTSRKAAQFWLPSHYYVEINAGGRTSFLQILGCSKWHPFPSSNVPVPVHVPPHSLLHSPGSAMFSTALHFYLKHAPVCSMDTEWGCISYFSIVIKHQDP